MRTIVFVEKRVLGQCFEREKRHIDTIRRDKKESIALIRGQKRKKKRPLLVTRRFTNFQENSFASRLASWLVSFTPMETLYSPASQSRSFA